jgi:carboxylesterase type B
MHFFAIYMINGSLGFGNGAKNFYDPSGLLARGDNKAIFVAFNYRVRTPALP